MRKAIEIINKRQMEQAAKEERKAKLREERRAAKEKELEAQYKTSAETGGRPWYKFW
jgi:cytochrome c oxidase assembly protein subunit 20